MTYKVFRSVTFNERLQKLSWEFKEWVDKIEEQLVNNPYVGDPLGVRWLREKKHGKFRIYFLIYDELASVFVVGISEKKDQQKVINTIRLLLDVYQEEIMNLLKK